MREEVDFDQSLEELTGLVEGDLEDSPTPLVKWIRRSWKTPISSLSDEEVGRLIVQKYGLPYILDFVWPKLQHDPLFEGGYYPGDILSNLIRWEKDEWRDRPEYKEELPKLYALAMERPLEEKESFLDSLGLPMNESSSN
jgi:CDI immunity proteins